MTTITLHQTPGWPAVIRRQIRSVGGAVRMAAVVSGSIVLMFCVLSIIGAARSAYTNPAARGFVLMPGFMYPAFILGLLMAAAMWQREEPSRRGYHLAMPVPATEHTAIRVAVGWGWLMIGVAALWAMLCLTGAAIASVSSGPFHFQSMSTWLWIEPFAAATMTYLLASIVMIATERPLGWLVGVPTVAFLLFQMPSVLRAPRAGAFAKRFLESPFGPTVPFWPVFTVGNPAVNGGAVDWQRSLFATALWTAIGIAGVWLAARKHPRGAK